LVDGRRSRWRSAELQYSFGGMSERRRSVSADRRKALFYVSLECVECAFPWCTARPCSSPLCTATSRSFHSRFPQFPNFPRPIPGTLWNFIEYARYAICRIYKSSVINRVNYSSRGSLSRQEHWLHEMSCDLPKHRTIHPGKSFLSTLDGKSCDFLKHR
jgi:hypothetical protein